jgi:hypothetical protein
LLSADAAAQIREALVTVLEGFGQDLEERDEPGLSERTRFLAGQLRTAYRLLDVAAA